MVFDFTCLATRNAKRRSRNSALVGARLVTGRKSMSSTTALSRVCTRSPPATVLAVKPAVRGSGSPPASRSRKFFFAATSAIASSVASKGSAIGIDEGLRLRHAAGIGVLDDGACGGARRIELGDAFIGRVGVVDVVVGELLALNLTRGRDAKARRGRAIER